MKYVGVDRRYLTRMSPERRRNDRFHNFWEETITNIMLTNRIH